MKIISLGVHSCINLEVVRGKVKLLGQSSLGIPENVQGRLPRFDTAWKNLCNFNMFMYPLFTVTHENTEALFLLIEALVMFS